MFCIKQNIPNKKGRPYKYVIKPYGFDKQDILIKDGFSLVKLNKKDAKKLGFSWSKFDESKGYIEVCYTNNIRKYGKYFDVDGFKLTPKTDINVIYTPIYG